MYHYWTFITFRGNHVIIISKDTLMLNQKVSHLYDKSFIIVQIKLILIFFLFFHFHLTWSKGPCGLLKCCPHYPWVTKSSEFVILVPNQNSTWTQKPIMWFDEQISKLSCSISTLMFGVWYCVNDLFTMCVCVQIQNSKWPPSQDIVWHRTLYENE